MRELVIYHVFCYHPLLEWRISYYSRNTVGIERHWRFSFFFADIKENYRIGQIGINQHSISIRLANRIHVPTGLGNSFTYNTCRAR